MSEQTEFNRIHALMKFERDDLANWLGEFFGFHGHDGTYCYHLTRVKEAFHVGTMSLEDFQEFDDSTCTDLADFLISKLKGTDDASV